MKRMKNVWYLCSWMAICWLLGEDDAYNNKPPSTQCVDGGQWETVCMSNSMARNRPGLFILQFVWIDIINIKCWFNQVQSSCFVLFSWLLNTWVVIGYVDYVWQCLSKGDHFEQKHNSQYEHCVNVNSIHLCTFRLLKMWTLLDIILIVGGILFVKLISKHSIGSSV